MADSDISDRLVLVAGMHRSGTSALTRILNLLGAHIPEPVVPAFRGNEHGHWEPEAVVHMNDRFLAEAGVHVNTSVPIDPEWFRSPQAARAAEEIARFLGPQVQVRARVVVKDPRIALLAPVWRRAVEQIGVTPRFVLPFRRPQEVAASLARRQLRFFPDDVWPLQRGVLIWLTHVVELERATRGALRSFIGFDELLLSWRPGVERVLRQIDMPLSIEEAMVPEIAASIRGNSRREFARDEDDVPPLVARVLAALHACTQDPAASPVVLDLAAAELASLRLLAGGYLGKLEEKVEGWADLRSEADRAAADRDAARSEVRRLELRSTAAERASAGRNDERERLKVLAGAERLDDRLKVLRDAHALAAAQDEADRQTRRSEALTAVQRERAVSARRERERHALRLRNEASALVELDGALARERLRTEALESALAEAVAKRQEAITATAEHERLSAELARTRAYAAKVAQEKLATAVEATAQRDQAHAEREKERSARRAAETRVEALNAEVAALRHTLSWRVTAPIRRIRARLR